MAFFWLQRLCTNDTNSGDLNKANNYLSQAAHLNQSEPSVFLALGIALQLLNKLDESEDAFRQALELDCNYILAYNSLSITQKKMGKYDIARHNLEEALRLMARAIAYNLQNSRKSPLIREPNTWATHWTGFASQVAMAICAMDSKVSRLAWPTEEIAAKESKDKPTKGYSGLISRNQMKQQ